MVDPVTSKVDGTSMMKRNSLIKDGVSKEDGETRDIVSKVKLYHVVCCVDDVSGEGMYMVEAYDRNFNPSVRLICELTLFI